MCNARVAVVSDSAASIPYNLQSRLGVVVVPVHVSIDGRAYVEGVNVSSPRVIDALMAGASVSTSEPTPEEFVATYDALARRGAEHVVSVHVASALSKTYESAVTAATSSPIPVTVIDTGTIAMAEGFAALAAAGVAAYDGEAPEVAEAARTVAQTARFAFTVETLDYLRRGGRVSGVVAAIGSVLNIRPVMEIRDGETLIVDRLRGTDRAREAIRSSMEAHAATLRHPVAAVALVGGNAVEAGLGITARVQLEASPGASLTAHTGPGTYAVAVADMPSEYFLAS
jgi:DegV family protein with EDD domain